MPFSKFLIFFLYYHFIFLSTAAISFHFVVIFLGLLLILILIPTLFIFFLIQSIYPHYQHKILIPFSKFIWIFIIYHQTIIFLQQKAIVFHFLGKVLMLIHEVIWLFWDRQPFAHLFYWLWAVINIQFYLYYGWKNWLDLMRCLTYFWEDFLWYGYTDEFLSHWWQK